MVDDSKNRNSLIFFLLSCVFAFLQWGLPLLGFNSINFGWILIIAAFICGAIALFVWRPSFKLSLFFKIVIVAVVGIIYFGSIIYYKNEPQKQITQKMVKNQDLHELFKTDFPNTIKFDSESEFHTRYGTIVKIIEREYMDYDSKSKYLGFYIPSSSYSYDVCKSLVDECTRIIRKKSQVKIIGWSDLTDYNKTSSDNLTFSGRVYIYHEDELSLQQLAELERLYKSKGLSVIFRSHGYMTFRWLGNKK